jgi:hypothetical protein
MGLVYLAGAKSFRWTAFGVAFITVSAALTVFEYRPVTSVLAAAKTSARRPAFKSLVSEVSTFATSSECRGGLDAATDKPRYFAQASQVQGNLLVVGFEDQIGRSFEDHIGHMVFVHSPSYIEGYLPPSLLAQQPSDVRLIAIVQAIHPEFTGKESPLVMESVLYRWPDRTLIASAKLEIGCTTKHRGFQVFPAAAKALHNFMDTALKESANPANVSKPVERLTVGMTLDEVQAILGKGSCYADLDLTHVDLGFSIEDPELQHNTYVWIQPADNSNISVTFKRGRLVHSFSRLPPPK